MGGGSSKNQPAQQRQSLGPSSKAVQRRPSGVIDLSASRDFSHQDGFVDDGKAGLPPKLGAQLLTMVPGKHRAAWTPFFSALQKDASKEELFNVASTVCRGLVKDHGMAEKGLRTSAGALQAAVAAVKWPLDSPLARALTALEEEVQADTDVIWTDLSLGDFCEKLLRHLGEGAAQPAYRQSARCRALYLRAIQALADASGTKGGLSEAAASGLRYTLAEDCFQSLSLCELMRKISPFLLEKSKSTTALLDEYNSAVDGPLFGSGTSLQENMAVLDHVGKELFLNLFIGNRIPADIVLSRETVFEDLVQQLQTHDSQPLQSPSVLTLRAYFRSQYGKKEVNGQQVEEGEGLGPRKEFYSLASLYLPSNWKNKVALSGTTFSVGKGDSVVTASSDAVDLASLVKPGMRLSIGPGEDDRPQNETAKVEEVVSNTQLRVSHRFQTAHNAENAWVATQTHPLFVYHKAAAAHWYNAALPDSTQNREKYLVAGRMIAASVADRCKLDVVLAEPVFAHLVQRSLNDYAPTEHDLLAFDTDLAAQVSSVRKLNKAQLRDMIEDADLDPETVTTVDQYIAYSCKELLFDSVSWQAEALHAGFSLGIHADWWTRCAISPLDLQSIVCGSTDTTADFDFRKVFRVVEDPELQQSAPLRDALWSTIDSLDKVAKRKLLRFITGVDRLPSPGTEMIKIEMPFMAYSAEEHKKTLLMMPQAHTCDNILELPNYWQSLQAVRECEDPEGKNSKLTAELRNIIKAKVETAFSLSDGFGLDMAFSD